MVHVVPTKKTVVAEDETVEEGGREEKGESGEVEEKGEDGAKEDTDSRGLVLPKVRNTCLRQYVIDALVSE